MSDDPKIPSGHKEDLVISFEADPPGPDEVECLIEPAPPPDVVAVEEQPEKIPEKTTPEITPEITKPAEPQTTPSKRTAPRLVIAIASGKGGAGKSMLAAGMGVFLAQIGRRVVLVDANLGSGNLHSLLGMIKPDFSLQAFLAKQVKRIEEVISETPFHGLGLVASHSNAVGSANLKQAQKTRLLHQLRSLAVDYVILDLPAGSDFNVLDFFLAADLHVAVTVPEPTAIESTFRMVKSAFVRKMRSARGFSRLIEDMQQNAYFGIPTPNQIYQLAKERDPKLGEAVYQAMSEFKPRLVINKTRTREDLEIGPTLAVIGRRHLALPFDYLGYMDNDDVVWVTVRKRRPLLVEYPEAKIAKDVERVTRRVLSLEKKERPECTGVPKTLSLQNHYEILGLHPGATEEEVRRAQRRARRIYSPNSSTIVGIVPDAEVNEALKRIDKAHATLVDPEKRHLYDQNLFSEEIVEEEEDSSSSFASAVLEGVMEETKTTPLEPLPEMPQIDENTIFSGAMLQAVRQALGVDLQDIAERTKISKTYLRAIEEEDYVAAPAPVYLRGFVKTLAKDLKLEPEQVARTYMERYETAHPSKG